MTTTPPRPSDTGAYRDHRRRRGGAWWWWLLGPLLLAAIIAAIVIALVVHHHDHTTSSTVAPLTTSPAPSDASTPGTSTSPTPTTPAAATAADLVGGGGIAAKPATGTEADSGVVGTVLFAEASAAIDSTGEQVTTAAAQQLKADGATTVAVTGYTDVIAGQTVNDPLSQERAAAVATRLRALLPGVTVTANAKGQSDPYASNGTAAGRAQNRRAVITGS